MVATVFGGALVAGIFTYLSVFQRSEHHLHPQRSFQVFLTVAGAYIPVSHYIWDSSFLEAIKSYLLISGFFLVGVFSSVTIFRLFLNPLNAIPGPYFARLTKFNTCFRNAKLDSCHQLRRLHQRYGEFVRVGPNDISVTDPDGIQVVFGAQTKCTKASWYDGDYPLQSMHTTRDKKLHDKRRRIWAPAFSDKALRGYESRIEVYNELLIKKIQARLSKYVLPCLGYNRPAYSTQENLLMLHNGSITTLSM